MRELLGMKLSFCTLGCPNWDLYQIAARAREYGYDGVELRIGGDKHVDTALSREERQAALNLFKERGLEISALSGYTRFSASDRESLEQNKRQMSLNIQLACDLHAPYIRSFIGEGLPKDDIALQAEYLHACGEEAKENGIIILIETHDANKSGKRTSEIVKAADSQGIGVLWDVHNALTTGETLEETFKWIGGDVKHLHVKDSKVGDTLPLCFMGEGDFPARELMSLLKANHYNGYLSFEWEKMWMPNIPEPEEAFPQYVTFMRELMGH